MLDTPRPRELADFYVVYELNAFLQPPLRPTDVFTALHANIQDEFNRAGVQTRTRDVSAEARA